MPLFKRFYLPCVILALFLSLSLLGCGTVQTQSSQKESLTIYGTEIEVTSGVKNDVTYKVVDSDNENIIISTGTITGYPEELKSKAANEMKKWTSTSEDRSLVVTGVHVHDSN